MNTKQVLSSELMPIISEVIKDRDVTFLVSGTSMRPFYVNKRTSVTLSRVNDYFKYDVILYKYNQSYLLHRIIKIKGNKVTCQGDGTIISEVINRSDIIGVVISHQLGNKTILANNRYYRIKVRLWRYARPIRRLLLKFVRSK